MNKKWFKILAVIIVIELIVGGILFGYKKFKETNKDELSLKDKKVVELYKKIAYYDGNILDVQDPKTMLYYGMKNTIVDKKIACSNIRIKEDTSSYKCEKEAPIVAFKTLSTNIKNIYGPKVETAKISFAIDANNYAFYDEEHDSYVILTKNEESSINPVNMSLKQAKKKDGKIILTVDILDGIFGTVKESLNYVFTENDNNYYLTGLEHVKG